MSQITIYHSETKEPKEIEASTKDELVDRDLIFYDGKQWLYNDCKDLQDALKELEPWVEPEDCEDCSAEAEDSNIEYERNMTWKDGSWVCDGCGRPQ